MTNKLLGGIIACLILLTSACSGANQETRQVGGGVELPTGAVAIKYQHHICCQVMLKDSIPARMIFDTGCVNLLLDTAFYTETFGENVNLRNAMLGGFGGSYDKACVDVNSWSYRIGEASKTEEMATVLNLRKIVGDDVDGMFGMEFMQGRRVELSYEKGYMRFLSAEEKIGEDFIRILCKWIDGKKRIILPLSIMLDGGYVFEGNFLVDTGMTGTLVLNSKTADKLKSEQHLSVARRMIYTVGGVGGSREDYVFGCPQISVGGNEIKDVRITWSGNRQGALADERYDGLIGNKLLDRFDVIFDFVDCAIYLRQNNGFSRPEPNDLGIALTPKEDHWIVNGMLEGGNAEKAGLRRGDRIEKINGMTADDPRIQSLYPLPDKLTLTVLRENEPIEIVIHKE